ncbi:MAG TPA: polysaccharide deacetylase family protein [Chitinophagaceae bacterium]|nr:polysaccharide deacetylase family protein [Chitinophagaceae bacterium]
MKTFLYALLLVFPILSHTQMTDRTYAEKLGFPKGAKVVILHVDDAGMSFDSNEGTVQALTKGVATSCSVMMPCPWVPAFVQFLQSHPQLDAGLHLTLTSEWNGYRWGPLAGKSAVPGLVDSSGSLWQSVEAVVQHATPDEVEKEIEAQYNRAVTMGFTPTHFDSHMGTLFASPAFMERYIKLGIKYHIPVMFPGGHAALITAQNNIGGEQKAQLQSLGIMLWNAGLPVLDDLHNTTYNWAPPKANAKSNYKTPLYINALKDIKPGLTMMIMHCTAPTEVFKEISDSGPSRNADLQAMLDPDFKKALQKENIILTTWREVAQRRTRLK